VAGGSICVSLTLAQGQQATEDADYTAQIRSNGRSAKLSMLFDCPNAEMAGHLRKILKQGAPLSNGSCTLDFCLRYADSHEQITMKQRGKTTNWVSLMAPGDNVKNATKYMQSSFMIGSQNPVDSAGEILAAWEHLEVLNEEATELNSVRADVMIVTNITSFVHDYRNFEWGVELSYNPDGLDEPIKAQGLSGPLEYYAKPKTKAELHAMECHKLERLAEKQRRREAAKDFTELSIPDSSEGAAVLMLQQMAESPRDASSTKLGRSTPREDAERKHDLGIPAEGLKTKAVKESNLTVGQPASLFQPAEERLVSDLPNFVSRSPVKELNMTFVPKAQVPRLEQN